MHVRYRCAKLDLRALTRIATPDTEAGLAGLAGPMTANQLERFASRGGVTVCEPDDCDELIRQYLERAPRRTGPTLIPIQV